MNIIEQLKTKHPSPEWQKFLSDKEKVLKTFTILSELSENEGIKIISRYFDEIVIDINDKLINSKELSETSRRDLFTKKETINFLQAFFKDSKKQKEFLENEIASL